MKRIDMGLNTEPDWLNSAKAIENWSNSGNTEMVERWKKMHEYSLGLKAEIEKAMEEDGECSLSWSCEGRTRHEMHSHQWKEALEKEHPDWEWQIEYNYVCYIRRKK